MLHHGEITQWPIIDPTSYKSTLHMLGYASYLCRAQPAALVVIITHVIGVTSR